MTTTTHRRYRTPAAREFPADPIRQRTSADRIAEILGVTERTVHRRWHHGLTLTEADLIATALGEHLDTVWIAA
jgi:glutathione S-transferase